MLNDKDKLSLATSFRVIPQDAVIGELGSDVFAIDVNRKAPGKFALEWRGYIWNGEDWVFSSSPSETTEEFRARSRFPLDEALEMAVKMVETITVFDMTFPEWKKFHEDRFKKLQEDGLS